MKALIISGGHIGLSWFKEFTKRNSYDIIIAVDGGLSAANFIGIIPDIIVGDFDTVNKELLEKYENMKDVSVIRLNPIKDDTDTRCALNIAIEKGADEVHITGALGSRADHSLGNIFLLREALDKKVKAYIYSETSKIHLIEKESVIKKDKWYSKYISFIQFNGPAKKVTLKGFAYEVSDFDFDLEKTYRMGISNEMISDTAEVTIGWGQLLVIECGEE